MKSLLRRLVLAGSAAAALVVTSGHVASISQTTARRPIAFRTQTMGTWATVTFNTADSLAVADVAYRALLIFHHVDSLMSNWTETSEVARINREAAAHDVVVDPEVARVLACAVDVSAATDGAMDLTVEPLVRLWGFLGDKPHVPRAEDIAAARELVGRDKMTFDAARGTIRFARQGVRIDLGGIAKGYSADEVAEFLRRAGATDALVDISGNMVAIGNAAAHGGWVVGVRDPDGKRPYIARLHLRDEAVSTSGNYEQFVAADGKHYGHIIDPRTGWSAQGLASVTVVTASGMRSDAWDTGLVVLGSKRAREIAHARDDIAVVLVEPQADGPDIVWVEEQLRSRFEMEPDAAKTHIVRYF